MHEALKKFARAKIRINRGQSWFSWFKDLFTFAALAVPFAHYIGVEPWFLWILSPVAFAVFYVVGNADEKRIKLWQYENGYSSAALNPWAKDIVDRLKRVEREIKRRG